jgi:solute carrier family 12 sodium/potassium/chloride transporter 2
MVTGSIIAASFLLRELNVAPPLITMFYLITYAMLNLVVLIEQSMGLVSFRPLLKAPRWVSGAGLIGSAVTKFIVHPVFSLTAVGVVLVFYVVLLRRRLDALFGDMRSGLLVTAAEWAAKKVAVLPQQQERAWKPNTLVPVEDPRSVRGSFLLLHDIAYPKGPVKLMGLPTERADRRLGDGVLALNAAFRDQGVFSSCTVLEKPGAFSQGLVTGMQALRGALFKPNIVFPVLPDDDDREEEYARIQEEAGSDKIGVLPHAPHPKSGLGEQRCINLWIRDRSPD